MRSRSKSLCISFNKIKHFKIWKLGYIKYVIIFYLIQTICIKMIYLETHFFSSTILHVVVLEKCLWKELPNIITEQPYKKILLLHLRWVRTILNIISIITSHSHNCSLYQWRYIKAMQYIYIIFKRYTMCSTVI